MFTNSLLRLIKLPNNQFLEEQQFFVYSHIFLINFLKTLIISSQKWVLKIKQKAKFDVNIRIYPYSFWAWARIVTMIMFYFSDRAYGFWWDTVLIHEKVVLEFVKEQQFYIDSHIILVEQKYLSTC